MFIKHENCVLNLSNVLDFYLCGDKIHFYFPHETLDSPEGKVTLVFKTEEDADEKFNVILQVLDGFLDLENQ